MKFIVFRKRGKKIIAEDGETTTGDRERMQPIVIEKTEKFGKLVSQNSLSAKTRCIVIAGPHNCGKTRYLVKWADMAAEFWKSQLKPYSRATAKGARTRKDAPVAAADSAWEFPEPLFLAGLNPVISWLDNDGVEAWWNETRPDDKPWAKLQQYRKTEALPLYLKERRAVLFVDDAHKLVGRKLQIVKLCFMAAPRCVLTCEDEGMIPMSLRMVVMASEPHIVRLHSEASYDYTAVFMWLLMGLLVAAGQWQVAMFLAGAKYLAGGRRAAKI